LSIWKALFIPQLKDVICEEIILDMLQNIVFSDALINHRQNIHEICMCTYVCVYMYISDNKEKEILPKKIF
jgi:hypothetical protein